MDNHDPRWTVPVRIVPGDKHGRVNNVDWAIHEAVPSAVIVSNDRLVDRGILDEHSGLAYLYGLGYFFSSRVHLDGLSCPLFSLPVILDVHGLLGVIAIDYDLLCHLFAVRGVACGLACAVRFL